MDDWQQLPSSRFFQLAERLPAYSGVVRAVLVREVEPQQANPVAPAAAPAVEMAPGTLAALSDHPGFPSIEFTGG